MPQCVFTSGAFRAITIGGFRVIISGVFRGTTTGVFSDTIRTRGITRTRGTTG